MATTKVKIQHDIKGAVIFAVGIFILFLIIGYLCIKAPAKTKAERRAEIVAEAKQEEAKKTLQRKESKRS